jgi:WD40 repeat protein
MSTSPRSGDYGRFDELAEEFVDRYRRGERPKVEEYVDRLPEMADEIRQTFPALAEVEQAEDDARRESSPLQPSAGPRLRQIGDYRIVRVIGRGGMGVVYEAEQLSLGRRVALKVLPAHVIADDKMEERFRREAKAAARLHHTNIVSVFEVGRDRDVSFYAMQLIVGQGLEQVIDELRRLRDPLGKGDGQDLSRLDGVGAVATVDPGIVAAAISTRPTRGLGQVAELLLSGRLVSEGSETAATDPGSSIGSAQTERFESEAAANLELEVSRRVERPAPSAFDPASSAVLPGGTHVSEMDTSGRRQPFFRSVAQIGRQAAQGLAYAHARGIIHRDIKPSNLLLDTSGVVWITDFGLAKAEDDGLTATGDVFGTLRYMAPERFRGEGDARADVYGLGLTLYELLTLRAAFESSDRVKLIERVKAEEPTRPRSIDRRIPRDLETIVLKAIEKEPGARYATAEAMAEDLRRFLADEPIRARQIATSERYWRWARRNPVIAILGGALTALLIAVTIGSMLVASRYGAIARSERLANALSQVDRTDALKARQQALAERDNSRRLSASLTFEKGLALAQEGQADRGLLWMLEALKTAPEDAKEFRNMVRWNLNGWLGQVHKLLRIIDTGAVDTVAFSPDGRTLATGFNPEDRAIALPINLWDTASGRRISTIAGAFALFVFRADGKVLFAHADAKRAVAVDMATARILWTSSHLPGTFAQGIDVSPDGHTVFATRYEKPGNVWLVRLDAATGQARGAAIPGTKQIAVASDGQSFATFHIESGEAYIDIHELPSGRRASSWPTGKLDGYDLVTSPDGNSIFSVVSEGDEFSKNSLFGQIWRTPAGRPVGPLMARTNGVVYFPSADRLLTRADAALFLRDATGYRVRGSGLPSDATTGAAYRFAVHPDGRTVPAPGRGNTVWLWQVSTDAEPAPETGPELQTSASPNKSKRQSRGLQAVWSSLRSDGQIAVSLVKSVAGRELIRITDPATGLMLARPVWHQVGWNIGALEFSGDGRTFATGSNPDGRTAGEVRLWEASTGRLLLPPMLHTNDVRALAFRPDGKVLAAGDYNGLVRFWDTSTGREVSKPLPQREIVLSLAYSPDGKILAAGLSRDHTGRPGTRLWDLATNQPIGELLPSPDVVTRIKFRPDGRALITGPGRADDGSSTRLWDATRAQPISDVIHEEIADAFSPDGRTFLTLGTNGTVKLRDARTGEPVTTLLTGSRQTICAAFRRDGKLVAAGFADGSVRLADPVTSQPVGPARSMRNLVRRVAFTPDGRSVAAIDEFGDSHTWLVPEPLEDASVADLTLRIEARTGLRIDTGPTIARLTTAAWSARLEELGRLDSIAREPEADYAWHEMLVREAEENGNTFSAIWHLDRMIAARPDDWYLYARRARASSIDGHFERAVTDFAQAERLGKRDQVLDYQVQCVADCTNAKRWEAALWYLDRLIAARPSERLLYEDRAAVYGKLGREPDRQADLARVFELGPDQELVLTRAEELGRSGRWPEAAGLLARCGHNDPVGRELAQAWGIACVKAGDRAGYREACAAFMAREGPEPSVVWNGLMVASLLAFAPQAIDDFRVPIAYFEKRLSAAPAPPPLYSHLFSNALAGLHLRAGRLDEAIARANQGVAAAKEVEVPTDWAYLALAHARAGRSDEARRWLDRLRATRPDPQATFWDLQEIALLQGEVESLLKDAGRPRDPFQAGSPK